MGRALNQASCIVVLLQVLTSQRPHSVVDSTWRWFLTPKLMGQSVNEFARAWPALFSLSGCPKKVAGPVDLQEVLSGCVVPSIKAELLESTFSAFKKTQKSFSSTLHSATDHHLLKRHQLVVLLLSFNLVGATRLR